MEYCQKYNSKYNSWGKGVVFVSCNVGGNCLLIGKIREGGGNYNAGGNCLLIREGGGRGVLPKVQFKVQFGGGEEVGSVNCLLKSVVFY